LKNFFFKFVFVCLFEIVRQLWDKGSAQWVGSEHGGPQAGGVQDPDGMGVPDGGAEGDCVCGGLQSELKG
jgi:hypothetical protein